MSWFGDSVDDSWTHYVVERRSFSSWTPVSVENSQQDAYEEAKKYIHLSDVRVVEQCSTVTTELKKARVCT